MKKTLLKIRNKWIWEKWEENKNNLDMEDIAVIFNLPASTVYRTLQDIKVKVENKTKGK